MLGSYTHCASVFAPRWIVQLVLGTFDDFIMYHSNDSAHTGFYTILVVTCDTVAKDYNWNDQHIMNENGIPQLNFVYINVVPLRISLYFLLSQNVLVKCPRVTCTSTHTHTQTHTSADI